jgi:folate-binding protein YgfZ
MEQDAITGVFFDLSTNVKLRVEGNDRLRFLNGQITADISKATASNAIEACLLDGKGRMSAHVFIFGSGDSFFIDADSGLKEALQARLERYVIADDVQIEDVSDQLSIFHVMAQTAPAVPAVKWMLSARRFGQTGWDIWIDGSERDKILAQLSASFSFCDADCLEIFRIERGIPRWGKELTSEIIPVEAGLDERCIDYEKGCYLGQEVISRMKMSGQRNKKLCGLASANEAPLSAGMRLFEISKTDKDVGWITSASRSRKLNREVALGFVKRGFNAPGTNLEARPPGNLGSGSVRVEVVDLPFAQLN